MNRIPMDVVTIVVVYLSNMRIGLRQSTIALSVPRAHARAGIGDHHPAQEPDPIDGVLSIGKRMAVGCWLPLIAHHEVGRYYKEITRHVYRPNILHIIV